MKRLNAQNMTWIDTEELAALRAENAELRKIVTQRNIVHRTMIGGRNGYVLLDKDGYAPLDSALYPTPCEAIDAAIAAAQPRPQPKAPVWEEMS